MRPPGVSISGPPPAPAASASAMPARRAAPGRARWCRKRAVTSGPAPAPTAARGTGPNRNARETPRSTGARRTSEETSRFHSVVPSRAPRCPGAPPRPAARTRGDVRSKPANGGTGSSASASRLAEAVDRLRHSAALLAIRRPRSAAHRLRPDGSFAARQRSGVVPTATGRPPEEERRRLYRVLGRAARASSARPASTPRQAGQRDSVRPSTPIRSTAAARPRFRQSRRPERPDQDGCGSAYDRYRSPWPRPVPRAPPPARRGTPSPRPASSSSRPVTRARSTICGNAGSSAATQAPPRFPRRAPAVARGVPARRGGQYGGNDDQDSVRGVVAAAWDCGPYADAR